MSTRVTLLASLKIPADYAQFDRIDDLPTLTLLETWKQQTSARLEELKVWINEADDNASIEVQSDIIRVLAAYDGEGQWVTESNKSIAREILATLEINRAVVQNILNSHLKPLFFNSPHPLINLSTGRKMVSSAGGFMASQDYYEGQMWKYASGSTDLVSWCVKNTQPDWYESLWHLIIPPVMTIVDDFQALYKLRGVRIVSELLGKAPTDLLRRTGVDGLLFASLSTAMTALRDPNTPELLKISIQTTLALVEKMTGKNSVERFDRLCQLVGEDIIGKIFTYVQAGGDAIADRSLDATVEVLPETIVSLGIGSARYLKALIPHLLSILSSPTSSSHSKQISCKALDTIITQCAPCMSRWQGILTNGMAKAWVISSNLAEVRQAILKLANTLARIVPAVKHDTYAKLLTVDKVEFKEFAMIEAENGC